MSDVCADSENQIINILLVEDDPDDAELIVLALEDAGLRVKAQGVETADEMRAALNKEVLNTGSFHVILSDYSIPGFGGSEALALMQMLGLDLPFIIISGEIGEDTAVELMKAGVHDYVAKGRLARLAPAIEREIREAEIRRSRRQTEQSLRDSQQRYAALIQSIDGMVWESGSALGPLVFVSQQAETILGFSTQYWTEQPEFWRENIYQDDREWVLEQYTKAIAQRRPFQLEYRRHTARGDILWLRDVVSIAQEAQGELLIRGVTFDVTERRTAEEERERLLSLTEQRAREMSTIADISAALRSASTRQETLTIVMESLRRLLPIQALSYHPVNEQGIEPSARSVGDWPSGYLHYLETDPGPAALITSAFESVVMPPSQMSQSTVPGRAVGLPLRAQGNLVGVLWGYYQNYRGEGSPSRPLSVSENRLLTALADIIAAALYRAGLYEETQVLARQMEEMMASTPQGLALLNERGEILLANPAARQALEALAPDCISGPLTHLGLHNLMPMLQAQRARLCGARESRFEAVSDSPPNKIFEVSLRPVDIDFALQSWLLILNDVTEERLEQDRLQKQHRLAAVGQLAAGIAHDFNNSLGVIRLYTDLVQRHADLSERDRERMQTVSKQIGHATHLIHQILDFSRRSMMERKTLDLHELITDLFGILQHTLARNIDLTYAHDNRPITILGDKTRIQQAIFNLVVNARDAMPDGGTISFALKTRTTDAGEENASHDLNHGAFNQDAPTPGKWAVLSIADTGHGIDETLLPKLFEPFFTTKPAGHGTGLGLAQVYGIIKQHEGHITVDTHPGIGTTFTLYFPIDTPESDEEPEDATENAHPVRRTILLVEDDPAGREALGETLKEYGYTVMTAENGREALNLLQESTTRFDLIISDLVMPVMSGTQLFEHLRDGQFGIPMIVITGYPLADGGQELLEQGIVDWLAKPFNAEMLRAKIEATFDS